MLRRRLKILRLLKWLKKMNEDLDDAPTGYEPLNFDDATTAFRLLRAYESDISMMPAREKAAKERLSYGYLTDY
jgi:hypothetical protein